MSKVTKCPHCVSGKVNTISGGVADCNRCNGTGVIHPVPDVSAILQRYNLGNRPMDQYIPALCAEIERLKAAWREAVERNSDHMHLTSENTALRRKHRAHKQHIKRQEAALVYWQRRAGDINSHLHTAARQLALMETERNMLRINRGDAMAECDHLRKALDAIVALGDLSDAYQIARDAIAPA